MRCRCEESAECGVRNNENLKNRTKKFAIEIIRLAESLPRGRIADIIGRQLVRSGTSVGANYRASCRAKSSADFISKMSIVEEEADETIYWLELLVDSGAVKSNETELLMNEANELLAITVSSIRTAKSNRK